MVSHHACAFERISSIVCNSMGVESFYLRRHGGNKEKTDLSKIAATKEQG